jgi:hypothetical protein
MLRSVQHADSNLLFPVSHCNSQSLSPSTITVVGVEDEMSYITFEQAMAYLAATQAPHITPATTAHTKKYRGKTSSPAANTTAKRDKDLSFDCKVCARSLSGDHFYERHLQCINCQMAINSVSRALKVGHADAKSAYIEAVRELSHGDLVNLDSIRDRVQADAEARFCNPAAGNAQSLKRSASGSASGAPTKKEPSKRRRTTAQSPADSGENAPARQSNRLETKAAAYTHPEESPMWGPCYGMYLLIKACEEDLAKMN